MCGRDPEHYAEYWKAVQEMWLRFYLSNLVVIAAINVSVPGPQPSPADSLRGEGGQTGPCPREGWGRPSEVQRSV